MFTICYSWRASFDGQILAHMILFSCDSSDGSRVVSRLVKIICLVTQWTRLRSLDHERLSVGAGLITDLSISKNNTWDRHNIEKKRHATPQKMKTHVFPSIVLSAQKQIRESKTDLGKHPLVHRCKIRDAHKHENIMEVNCDHERRITEQF